MAQTSRAALAAAAAVLALLAWAAPSAAQDGLVSTPGTPPTDGAASKVFAAEVVHTRPFTRAAMKRAVRELSANMLTDEQAAAVAQAVSSPAPEAAGVESAASYAPETGGAVPMSQVRFGSVGAAPHAAWGASQGLALPAPKPPKLPNCQTLHPNRARRASPFPKPASPGPARPSPQPSGRPASSS
jgi:hypothetical protein